MGRVTCRGVRVGLFFYLIHLFSANAKKVIHFIILRITSGFIYERGQIYDIYLCVMKARS